MSHSSPDTQQSVEPDVATAFIRLATESTQQVATAVRSGQPLVSAWVDLLRAAAALPTATLSAGRSTGSLAPWWGCCEIPETSCPPYCVCDIAWEGVRGEHLKATIRLTNTRNAAQNFTLAATPFQGPSGDAAATVTPAAVLLKANESASATVSFEVPETFTVGDTYDARIRITGLYEQCVRLRLRVRPVPHCDVKQGEIPKRIRAHRWYDHFQCEELCFEPVRTATTGQGQGAPLPVADGH